MDLIDLVCLFLFAVKEYRDKVDIQSCEQLVSNGGIVIIPHGVQKILVCGKEIATVVRGV
ncbi:hypothetical protein DN388_03810 [Pseudomonas sp. S12(2018)]|nr:hypothetical protein [Pseudomonas sp. S12(2018)]